MSVVQIMVTIIIVTILVTVILGVVSYAAYWIRRVRRPGDAPQTSDTPRFFYRYIPAEKELPVAGPVAAAIVPADSESSPLLN